MPRRPKVDKYQVNIVMGTKTVAFAMVPKGTPCIVEVTEDGEDVKVVFPADKENKDGKEEQE